MDQTLTYAYETGARGESLLVFKVNKQYLETHHITAQGSTRIDETDSRVSADPVTREGIRRVCRAEVATMAAQAARLKSDR